MRVLAPGIHFDVGTIQAPLSKGNVKKRVDIRRFSY
jgi:hypothetical protein